MSFLQGLHGAVALALLTGLRVRQLRNLERVEARILSSGSVSSTTFRNSRSRVRFSLSWPLAATSLFGRRRPLRARIHTTPCGEPKATPAVAAFVAVAAAG